MPVRRAIYPGTFDPITNGHLDLVHRAVRLFDELIVAVAANPQKEPLLSLAIREDLVKQSVKGLRKVSVMTFEGLLVDLAREQGALAVVRGLRAISDFEMEFQMALANRQMYPDCESVYLMPSAEQIFVSSTIIKNIARHGGRIRPFVPPHVERRLAEEMGVGKSGKKSARRPAGRAAH